MEASSFPMLGVFFALAAAICWGSNPVFARHTMARLHVFVANFYATIVGLILLVIFSYFSGDLAVLPSVPSDQYLVFAGVGICTIVLGRTSYYLSIHRIGAGSSIAIVGASVLVAPVIAFLALNEMISVTSAIGIVLVFIGIYFVAQRDQ